MILFSHFIARMRRPLVGLSVLICMSAKNIKQSLSRLRFFLPDSISQELHKNQRGVKANFFSLTVHLLFIDVLISASL